MNQVSLQFSGRHRLTDDQKTVIKTLDQQVGLLCANNFLTAKQADKISTAIVSELLEDSSIRDGYSSSRTGKTYYSGSARYNYLKRLKKH